MSTATATLRFTRGSASGSELQDAARAVVAELADPASEAAAAAQRAGLDPAALRDARVDVAETEHGADPFLTPIVIGIVGSLGSKVVETLWTQVIWPRIRRRLGADALGERQDGRG